MVCISVVGHKKKRMCTNISEHLSSKFSYHFTMLMCGWVIQFSWISPDEKLMLKTSALELFMVANNTLAMQLIILNHPVFRHV